MYLAFITSIFLALWYLYAWLYKDYTVDLYRQKIFELRDDLFDFAADGHIGFNHPAYCVLRRTMNGHIRFSHRINLLALFVHSFLLDKETIANTPFSFEKQFTKSLSSLEEKTAKKLITFKINLRNILTIHLLIRSPILTILVVLFFILTVIPVVALIVWGSKAIDFCKQPLLGKIRNIEAEAFALGKL